MHLDIGEIRSHLKKVYNDGWNYSKGHRQYFASLRKKTESLSGQLSERRGEPVFVAGPVGDINCYRICFPLEPGLPADRYDLSTGLLQSGRTFAYLEILIGVVAIVAEVSVHVYTYETNAMGRNSFDIDDQLPGDLPSGTTSLFEEIKSILKDLEIPRIPRSITESVVSSELPRDLVHRSGPARLRDYLFLNGCD